MAQKTILFAHFDNIINSEARTSTHLTRGINPSTGLPLWDVPVAGEEDLNHAVAAAQKAFQEWSLTSGKQRQGLLAELRGTLLGYREEMVELLMKETGKPRALANIEVEHTAGFMKFQSETLLPEDVIVQDDEDLRITERYILIGVVGAICPWNFPLILAVAKIGAAIVTGNCVIVKPSPFTPYSILKLAEMANSVFPPGVFQAINGDDKLGPLMVAHSGIGKISFTGSTATGKRIMESASKTLKNVTLELGGNNATIVCPDVDIAKVAPQIAIGAFFNSGQMCVATKRIYVHEDIYSGFRDAMTAIVKSWKAGPASDSEVMLGPVQNHMQYEIVQGFYEDCHSKGYKFGTGSEGAINGKGYFFEPAIIDNPPDKSRIVMEEPFGPIVPIQTWKTENELLARVNDTFSGLGGSVWSSDPERAQNIARRIEAGTI